MLAKYQMLCYSIQVGKRKVLPIRKYGRLVKGLRRRPLTAETSFPKPLPGSRMISFTPIELRTLPMKAIIQKVVSEQNLSVDVVTGASRSSKVPLSGL